MKTILVVIFILSITVLSAIENGKLSGVVTYKDAYGLSIRADAGSEIYAVNEADVTSKQSEDITEVIDNFQMNKAGYSQQLNSTIDPVRVKRIQDDFDAASNYVMKYISGFKQSAVARTVTNSSGNYSLSLSPGRNYVLVISGSVKSNNPAEFKGNIDYRVVDIRSAGKINLDFTFQKHEMIGIRGLVVQPGC